ncbi:LTA synthase family protein, partial [Alistipes senegalensis]
MRRKLAFPIAVFAATVVMMAVQKPVFMAYYAVEAAGAGIRGWIDVLWHGLTLDMTVAGYVTALPILVTLLSLWLRLPEKVWRGVLTTWFVLVAVTTAVIFAVDVALYEHWGFRIDSTVLIYLADPEEAMASVDFWLGVRQTLLAAAYAAGMIWVYHRILGVFDGRPVGWRVASLGSLAVVMLAGFDFLAIRGGTGASVANVSKVYFSSTQFLNHAATNPVFSFLASLGDRVDYADEYPFFDEAVRAAKFDALRGNGPAAGPTEPVLNTARPNVVIVILESFARTVMDAEVGGEPVMPYMQRLKGEGIWFENFFANSFRTDRGEVAILSGFPAQTRMSIMKLPAKSRNLPSIARSLAGEGYATSFAYGGDLNFTNQSSYMYATGWQELIWQKDLRFDAPAADWGYDDALMCDWFADRVIALSDAGKPFLAGLLTLSSHTPFDVPYSKFDDKVLNAMAFSDECVGKMINRLKASPAWKDLLVVLVADHGYPYPRMLTYNEPLRHRIPMIWTGGAVARPRVVEDYAAQIDIAATLLAQLGVAHDDFDYSKDIFAPTPPRKFAYYTFNDGFGVV